MEQKPKAVNLLGMWTLFPEL
uniref:Uncharacterized protein n=1 Tax=Anguilla anguilla TaxID=7936 RepID=A0A0E9RFE5_ANGAN